MKKLLNILSVVTLLTVMLALFAGCSNSSYIVTIEGEKVPSDFYKFAILNSKYEILSGLGGSGSDTPAFWDTKYSEDKTIGNVAEEQAKNLIIGIQLIKNIFNDMGLSYTDEQKNGVTSDIDTFISNSFDGDKGYREYLRNLGITKTTFEASFWDPVTQTCVVEALYGENSEDPLTETFAKEYFGENYSLVKHILIQNKDESGAALSESELNEKKKLAEDLLQKAKNGEDYDALMNEYSEDPGLASNPDGYLVDKVIGGWVQEFMDAAENMEIGELRLVESSYGYHIIKKLDKNSDPKFFDDEKDNLLNTLKRQKLSDKLMEIKENSTIEYNEKALEKYNAKTVFLPTS